MIMGIVLGPDCKLYLIAGGIGVTPGTAEAAIDPAHTNEVILISLE
jgi:ferredoxin-NADP reductase